MDSLTRWHKIISSSGLWKISRIVIYEEAWPPMLAEMVPNNDVDYVPAFFSAWDIYFFKYHNYEGTLIETYLKLLYLGFTGTKTALNPNKDFSGPGITTTFFVSMLNPRILEVSKSPANSSHNSLLLPIVNVMRSLVLTFQYFSTKFHVQFFHVKIWSRSIQDTCLIK